MTKALSIKIYSKIFTVLALFLLGNAALFSQRVIEIKYQQDAKNAYVFTAFNRAFCNYTLLIYFPVFNNVKSDRPLPYKTELKPGLNKLFSLSALNANDPVKFSYSANNHRGCIQPAADTSITYLLPVIPGREVQVYELSNQGKAATNPQNNWYGIRIKTKPGDTIYAARRGVVTEVLDGDSTNDAGLASAGHENYIEVIHADCTFGHYGILRRNGSLVRPGQLVKAGEAIGLVGGDPYGRGSEIRLSVYYNQETEKSSETDNSLNTYMQYVPFLCWTKNSGRSKLRNGALYSSEFPSVIVNREEPKKTPPVKTKRKK